VAENFISADASAPGKSSELQQQDARESAAHAELTKSSLEAAQAVANLHNFLGGVQIRSAVVGEEVRAPPTSTSAAPSDA
jgi:hypothetical protein